MHSAGGPPWGSDRPDVRVQQQPGGGPHVRPALHSGGIPQHRSRVSGARPYAGMMGKGKI